MLPPTFIAGVYGMNFDNMPELHSRYGYYAVWIIMLVVAVGMLGLFRRRGWIGSGKKRVRNKQEVWNISSSRSFRVDSWIGSLLG